MQAILQTESSECSLACLAMVSSQHGLQVDLTELRSRFQVSLKGATLHQHMAHAAFLNLSTLPMTCLKLLLIYIFLTLVPLSVHADSTQAKMPAAWAWKINSPKRKIYLLGEVHWIVGSPNLNIDYQLGQDAYRKSAQLWTEFDGLEEENKNIELIQLLKPETWDKVTGAVKKAVNDLEGMPAGRKESFYAEVIDSVKKEKAYAAYVILNVISSTLAVNRTTNIKKYMGLGEKLKLSEKLDYYKKRIAIEDSSAMRDAWTKNCNTAEKSEQIIQAALDKFVSPATATKSDDEKIYTLFFDRDVTLESFHNLFVKSSAGAVFEECIVRPRNILWLPKIVNALQTEGAPITVLVGVGHIGGDQGILALLQKEGYTDIKRIYAIKQ